MSHIELLNAGGYRADGRRQHELRSISLQIGGSSDPAADGCATISQGLTIVSATVFGPREARISSNTLHDRATVNVEVSLAPWGAMDRRKRNKGDRRLVEFASSVKSTFEPVIHTHLYPRSQIDIFIQVLQQDGGILPAAINASTLALIDAGIAVSDFVTSVSCGIHSTSPLLDLNNTEESDLPNMSVALLPRSGKVTLASLETRLHVERFEDIFRLAIKACGIVHQEMELAVRDRTRVLVDAVKGRIGEVGENNEERQGLEGSDDAFDAESI